MTQETQFQTWMNQIQARTESALARILPNPDIAPQRLHQAMRYTVLDGGKRIRALLCHAAGILVGADPEKLDTLACAVELIHAYSLVHDDLPCMDNDVLRRGKPTCHIEYNEATALLVGDSLQSLAFLLLAEHPICEQPSQQLHLISILARATGSRGMAGGQAIDLASIGKALTLEELEFMHIHKTGALIRAAVLLGIACGQPLAEPQITQLDHFAKCIGLLFQIIDDILDCESNTATLGKTAGKDIIQSKPTYVSILGINDARALANDLLNKALTALAPFNDRGLRLKEIAEFIASRNF